MQPPAHPDNEAQRLAELHAYEVLDTPPESAFDRIAELARDILETPIATVTLVDAERQWFKAAPGLEISETGREISFCGHAVCAETPLAVDDTHADERFRDNPLVTGYPGIRAYLGVPLIGSRGLAVGVLCVQDLRPRSFSDRDIARLERLAAMAVDELELRWARRQLHERAKEAECLGEIALLLHTRASVAGTLAAIAEHLPRGFRDPKQCQAAIRYREAEYGTPPTDPAAPVCRATISIRGEPAGEVIVGHAEPSAASETPFLDEEHQLVDRVGLILGQYLERAEIHEQLEAANRVKSQFLNAISHDLRTPLNAVVGFLDALTGTELDPQQREHVASCQRAGDKLRILIDNLLDLSRLEHGRLELAQRPFDLTQAIREQMELVEPTAHNKGLSLELHAEPPGPWWVIGDPDRVEQIMSNLLGNAVKFTQRGGVTVRLDRDAEQRVRIEVTDTGPGVPPEEREAIFNWFTQGTGATEQLGGTGLGLRICLELVNLMGGALEVGNHASGGARFTVRLPLHAAETDAEERADGSAGTAEEAEASPATDRAVGTPRVLVAEDDALNGQLAEHLLRQLGADPLLAEDGAQALALWRDHAPDLALLDVQMPGMEGPELVAAIRGEEQARGRGRMPITMLSAHISEMTRNACYEAGADGYLNKPVRIAELRRILEEAAAAPP